MGDLRYAWRTLRKSSVSVVAVLTLALGIGANTAIFSIVKAILLKPLPYRDPARIVALAEAAPDLPHNELVDPFTAEDWRRRSRSFENFAVYGDASGVLMQGGRPEVIRALRVTSGFFDTLGVRMQLGRGFLAEEDRPDRRTTVVILSDGLWKRHFGGDAAIVGHGIDISIWHYTVVGVLPPEFEPLLHGTTELLPEMYMPAGIDYLHPCRHCLGPHAIARLKPGIAIGEARAELNGIMRSVAREHPADYPRGVGVTVTPMSEFVLGRVRTALWLVLGAVGLVLLIACVNVANLLLARATARGTEIVLRAALGAGRWRLIRQLFSESLLLALTGGAAGLVLAWSGTGALASALPGQIPRVSGIRMDGAVFGFSGAASLLTAVLCGLAPAWYAARADLNEALKTSGKGTTSRGGQGLRSLLVAAEIAIAFVLVAGAGLMGKSVLRLLEVNAGFDPHNVLTLTTNVWGPRYETDAAVLNYYQRMQQKLEAVPGIEGAGWTSTMPLDWSGREHVHLQARGHADESAGLLVDYYSVSGAYFRVLKIPLRRGRTFDTQDTVTSPRVVVLTESCARLLFPGAEPVGKQVRLIERDAGKPWATVVGVVGDIRQNSLDTAPAMAVYTAQEQGGEMGYYRLVARTAGPPLHLQRAVQDAFSSVDRMLPVYHVKSLEDYRDGTLAPRTVTLMMLAFLGLLALLLASAGIYAAISYTVALRTREVGIRMALGARRSDVVTLIARQALAPAAAGLGLGIAASLWLMELLRSLLFDVRARDWGISALAVAALALAAFAGSFWPARRAARVDPATALREE
jgi:putative ABC transport system permease protein